ncbi:V-set and transmembrane domain-containing protein 1-like [Gracilinanus agilis]|uniref:V-set and transmembrane domain-containing protein 1-like n=1 Tax=Gracilinanus agilis TaxID=191870 RepID=UPI001CFE4ADA|nr:V-set and transmembrane domain-containing protein 1-like [Gracilinanus agilis]
MLFWHLTHMELSLIGLCLSQKIPAQEGSLPQPTLSFETACIMSPGNNLTLKCKKPVIEDLVLQKWTYLLLKEGNSQPLQSFTSHGSWANFILLWVSTQDSGNYRCKYFGSQDPQRESEASSALEICPNESGTVTIILSCVIILNFLFLLAFYHRSYIASLAHDIFPALGFHQSQNTQRGDQVYSRGQAETDPSTSGAEDYEAVIYSQLNIKALSRGQPTAYEKCQNYVIDSTVGKR